MMMMRRPYPHNQVNYNHPNQFDYSYANHPNQQPYYANMSANQFPSFQTPFEYYEKPRQPTGWPNELQQYQDFYPSFQPPNQSPSIFAQFKDQNGQVDINKTLSTVGQFANTVQQVTPVIKQISDLIKSFR